MDRGNPPDSFFRRSGGSSAGGVSGSSSVVASNGRAASAALHRRAPNSLHRNRLAAVDHHLRKTNVAAVATTPAAAAGVKNATAQRIGAANTSTFEFRLTESATAAAAASDAGRSDGLTSQLIRTSASVKSLGTTTAGAGSRPGTVKSTVGGGSGAGGAFTTSLMLNRETSVPLLLHHIKYAMATAADASNPAATNAAINTPALTFDPTATAASKRRLNFAIERNVKRAPSAFADAKLGVQPRSAVAAAALYSPDEWAVQTNKIRGTVESIVNTHARAVRLEERRAAAAAAAAAQSSQPQRTGSRAGSATATRSANMNATAPLSMRSKSSANLLPRAVSDTPQASAQQPSERRPAPKTNPATIAAAAAGDDNSLGMADATDTRWFARKQTSRAADEDLDAPAAASDPVRSTARSRAASRAATASLMNPVSRMGGTTFAPPNGGPAVHGAPPPVVVVDYTAIDHFPLPARAIVQTLDDYDLEQDIDPNPQRTKRNIRNLQLMSTRGHEQQQQLLMAQGGAANQNLLRRSQLVQQQLQQQQKLAQAGATSNAGAVSAAPAPAASNIEPPPPSRKGLGSAASNASSALPAVPASGESSDRFSAFSPTATPYMNPSTAPAPVPAPVAMDVPLILSATAPRDPRSGAIKPGSIVSAEAWLKNRSDFQLLKHSTLDTVCRHALLKPGPQRTAFELRQLDRWLPSNIRYLSGLPPPLHADLLRSYQLQEIPPGGVVYEKGAIGDALYIIQSGKVIMTYQERISREQYDKEQRETVGVPHDEAATAMPTPTTGAAATASEEKKDQTSPPAGGEATAHPIATPQLFPLPPSPPPPVPATAVPALELPNHKKAPSLTLSSGAPITAPARAGGTGAPSMAAIIAGMTRSARPAALTVPDSSDHVQPPGILVTRTVTLGPGAVFGTHRGARKEDFLGTGGPAGTPKARPKSPAASPPAPGGGGLSSAGAKKSARLNWSKAAHSIAPHTSRGGGGNSPTSHAGASGLQQVVTELSRRRRDETVVAEEAPGPLNEDPVTPGSTPSVGGAVLVTLSFDQCDYFERLEDVHTKRSFLQHTRILHEWDLFRHWQFSHLKRLSSIVKFRVYTAPPHAALTSKSLSTPPSLVIYKQNSAADSVYFIRSGTVTLAKIVPVKRTQRIPTTKSTWETVDTVIDKTFVVGKRGTNEFFGEESITVGGSSARPGTTAADPSKPTRALAATETAAELARSATTHYQYTARCVSESMECYVLTRIAWITLSASIPEPLRLTFLDQLKLVTDRQTRDTQRVLVKAGVVKGNMTSTSDAAAAAAAGVSTRLTGEAAGDLSHLLNEDEPTTPGGGNVTRPTTVHAANESKQQPLPAASRPTTVAGAASRHFVRNSDEIASATAHSLFAASHASFLYDEPVQQPISTARSTASSLPPRSPLASARPLFGRAPIDINELNNWQYSTANTTVGGGGGAGAAAPEEGKRLASTTSTLNTTASMMSRGFNFGMSGSASTKSLRVAVSSAGGGGAIAPPTTDDIKQQTAASASAGSSSLLSVAAAGKPMPPSPLPAVHQPRLYPTAASSSAAFGLRVDTSTGHTASGDVLSPPATNRGTVSGASGATASASGVVDPATFLAVTVKRVYVAVTTPTHAEMNGYITPMGGSTPGRAVNANGAAAAGGGDDDGLMQAAASQRLESIPVNQQMNNSSGFRYQK